MDLQLMSSSLHRGDAVPSSDWSMLGAALMIFAALAVMFQFVALWQYYGLPERAKSTQPAAGSRVLAMYFSLVIVFFLFAASQPGRYDVQFCDWKENPGKCPWHLFQVLSNPNAGFVAVCIFYGSLLVVGFWGLVVRSSPAFYKFASQARSVPWIGVSTAGEVSGGGIGPPPYLLVPLLVGSPW